MNCKTISFLVLFMFISVGLKSQLQVQTGLNISDLVQSVLIGENISGFNVEFNGQSADTSFLNVGSFNSEFSNIPIPDGIVMTTGSVLNVIGPNNSGGASLLGDAPNYDDIDLATISSPFSTNDDAILEMDFIASGNFISLSYVFSSEEYNEYVCSNYNDAFAIILSGPGIDGPYSNNGINIALIPDSDIPITINTVNNGSYGSVGNAANCPDSIYYLGNSDYFIDNQNNLDTTATQMDGFTIGMLVGAEVESGESYHIKFCIADAADGAFDSGMFLETNSFMATTINTTDIEEKSIKDLIQIYPNPTSDILHIENNSSNSVQAVTILDNLGRIVKIFSGMEELNINELKNGLYFIQIKTGDQLITKRIIKE